MAKAEEPPLAEQVGKLGKNWKEAANEVRRLGAKTLALASLLDKLRHKLAACYSELEDTMEEYNAAWDAEVSARELYEQSAGTAQAASSGGTGSTEDAPPDSSRNANQVAEVVLPMVGGGAQHSGTPDGDPKAEQRS